MNPRLEIGNGSQQTILQAILDHSLNDPEGADVKEFRFRFLKDRENLEKLVSGQLIKRNNDQTKY